MLLQVAALPPPVDEAFRLDIGIRFDIDLSHFYGGRLEDQGLEFDDGFTLRRGRVDARPHWGERFSGRGHWDVADGNVELKDGWLQYEWVPDGRVRLGLFREPMGLEALTSSRYVTFVERSAPTNAFTPGRNTGALVADTFGGGRCTWALGAFAISDGLAHDINGGDYSLAARLTWLALESEDGAELLHLGVAINRSDADDGEARFSVRPEIDRSDPVIDTGAFPADSIDTLGLELAWVRGPFSLQGELFRTAVDADDVSDPVFGGWYLQASAFLTADQRVYDRGKGAFGRVIPRSPWARGRGTGAWELALRASHTDFDDEGVSAGVLDSLNVGLNWHWSRNTRFLLDWVHSELEDTTADADLFLLRYQLDF